MKVLRHALVASVLAAVLAVGGIAAAAGFSPKVSFDVPSSINERTGVEFSIAVEQDAGEEELADVQLRFPRAWLSEKTVNDLQGCSKPVNNGNFPCDGEILGEGDINIMVGPGCAASPQNPAAAVNGPLPARLVVVNETADERQQGFLGIWNLEITGVTTIPFYLTKEGTNWLLNGTIEANPATCPPFDFTLTLYKTSQDSLSGQVKGGEALFTTPDVDEPTDYVLRAKFVSDAGSVFNYAKTVRVKP
jgi:hypothetical protein